MDEGKVENERRVVAVRADQIPNQAKTIGQPKLSLMTLSSGAEINIRRRDGAKNGSEVREAFLSGLTDAYGIAGALSFGGSEDPRPQTNGGEWLWLFVAV
jgi:hypothetical protein